MPNNQNKQNSAASSRRPGAAPLGLTAAAAGWYKRTQRRTKIMIKAVAFNAQNVFRAELFVFQVVPVTDLTVTRTEYCVSKIELAVLLYI